MKQKGGYNIRLAGRPSGQIEVLPDPDVLYLPLTSRRFAFTDVRVAQDERVAPGHVLATDPENYSVPLLAPRAGTVRLPASGDHIVLADVAKEPGEVYEPGEELAHIPQDMGSAGMKRHKLLHLGAWQFFSDARTGELPDPFGTPSAVIVSTLRLEPFLSRGDVQIRHRLASFTRGLEQLQSLLEYQPVFLVLPKIDSELASRVKETIRGYAWVNLIEISMKYGLEDYAVLARSLDVNVEAESAVWAARQDLPEDAAPANGPVWATGAGGVLALDRALTLGRHSDVRIISLSGPGVESPMHLRAMPGYPIDAILESRVSVSPARVVDGGVLTGSTMPDGQQGIGVECEGLTVLAEHTEREFLGFVRPGFDRRSYCPSFLSALRPAFAERLDTALRGERRPCVACGFCEEVCPARIMPHLLHKYLYQDELEEAEAAGLELCVRCGLCSYVCPSKIDLRDQLQVAQGRVRTELHVEEEVEA